MHGVPMQSFEAWIIVALGYLLPVILWFSLWNILGIKEDAILFAAKVKLIASGDRRNLDLQDTAEEVTQTQESTIAYSNRSLSLWRIFALAFAAYGLLIIGIIRAAVTGVIHLNMSPEAASIPWRGLGLGLLCWVAICAIACRWWMKTSLNRILREL